MAVCFTAISIQAQDVSDGVLFGQENLTGTARFRGMSGAFGALGGDLSAISINPASSAVFLRSSASFSLSGYNVYNESFYGDGLSINDDFSFNFNQAGGVFVFNNQNEEATFKKFSLALNYDLTNNLDDEYFAFGNTQSTIGNYFLELSQGVPLELLQLQEGESISDLYAFLGQNEGFTAQQAFLGFQGFITEPVADEPDNTAYTSNIAPGRFQQDYVYQSNGLNGKFSFNFGTELNNGLYLGANLNSHFINYERRTRLLETNSNTGSNINEVYFENNLRTIGTGFSAQIGAIYKFENKFRIGLSYDTPTYYNIQEETSQYLDTFSDADGEAIVNPNVINVFPEYELRTPGKYTASFAVLFGQEGLISVDYSYKDFTETEFSSRFNDDFDVVNQAINNSLKGVSTLRIGGEYRVDEWSVRGGFRFEESPYENETTLGNLFGYSAGVGYNFGSFKLGVAYDVYEQDRAPQLYNVGLTNRAVINTIHSNLTATLSFGL